MVFAAVIGVSGALFKMIGAESRNEQTILELIEKMESEKTHLMFADSVDQPKFESKIQAIKAAMTKAGMTAKEIEKEEEKSELKAKLRQQIDLSTSPYTKNDDVKAKIKQISEDLKQKYGMTAKAIDNLIASC